MRRYKSTRTCTTRAGTFKRSVTLKRLFFTNCPKRRAVFLRIVPNCTNCPMVHPFLRSHLHLAVESAIERADGGKTTLNSNILHRHLRMLGHEALRFFDAVVGDELVEIAAILGIDELAQVGSVERQHLAQIQQTELRIQLRFVRLHPQL